MLPGTPTFSRIWNLSPATLDELRREFDNAVGSVSGAVSRTCGSQPPLSVWESDERLVVEFDVPGVLQSGKHSPKVWTV
jgi:HSP20 family molecular chaperone IbpA